MKNYRRLANTGIVGVAFLLVLMTAGCVKKRPAAFDQGQGIDAQEVSSLSTKFTLTTGEPISGANGSEATSVEVSSDLMHAMNKFPLVTYETNCPLLGQDLPFRAKPHHQYEIRYQATDQNLIILKVAKKEDLPSDEWPYAQSLENDLVGVPLVGYPIRYFSVQKRVNEDNKPTSRLIEIPVISRSEASHFRIDRASPTISQAEAKIDVYPVSYFRGEWYYESTIIEAKIGQERLLGRTVGLDTRLNPATRVRMVFDSKNSLAGVNANHDERIAKDDKLNQAYVFSIPIEWKDYRVQKFGREAGISEETYTDKEVTQRPFIHLKFREINTPDDAISALFRTLSLDLSKLPGGERRLLDLKFSQDFFSFTILRGESGVKVRYAFRRIPEGVPVLAPRPANREDIRKFGYFVSSKHVIYDRYIQRQADIDAVGMMSRFNPMKKEIVYHFSNQTPANGSAYGWTREMARYAVHFFDQAFQMAGAPTRIRLDESKDVDVGDTRYNVINIVNPLNVQGLSGYGPSLADSRNGEIISATTNIQLSSVFQSYVNDIRYYIRSQLGMQDLALRSTPFVSQVKSPLTLMNPLNMGSGLFGSSLPDFEVTVDQQGDIEKRAPSRYVLGPDGQRPVSQIGDELFTDPKQRAYLEVLNGEKPIQSYAEAVSVYRQSLATPGLQNHLLFEAQGSPNRSGLSPYVERQIVASCPEVNEFVKRVKSTSQGIITSDEVAVIDQCVEKISRVNLLWVIEHELGHNFGFRHNFPCSNDSANFWTANEIRQMFSGLNGESFPEEFLPFGSDPVGSCVMDYYDNSHPILPVPGKYEIAAIKFMYAGKVDLANGTTVSVALKTGDGEVQYRSLESISGLKPYKFCTDEDVILGIDPMCGQFDTGLTPEEVVSNLIEDYWQSLISKNYRYDRVFSSMNPDVIFARREHILGQLKRFYDQWRFKLGEFVGQKDQYLESYDSKTYQDHVLSAMERSSLRNDYLAYKPVRDLISDFMIKLAFLPDKFCVGRTKTDYLVAIPLAQLRSEVALYQQGAEVDRCDSKGILELLSRRNVRFETEVGHGLKTTYYSSSPANLMRGQPDEIGTLIDHLLAIKLLSLRLDKGSLIHVAREFYPSMMDEPDIRGLILTKFLSRLSFGVDLSEDLKKVPQLANNPKVNQPFQVFSSDMGLFVPLMTSLKMGQMVPGKPDVNQIRMASFALKKVTPDSEVYNLSVKKGAAILPVPDGDVLLALPQNIFSYYLLNEVQRVQVNQVIGSGFSLDSPEIEKGISVLLEAFPDHDIEPFTLTNILDLLKKFAELKDKDDLASSHRTYLTQLFFGYSQAIGPKSAVFAAAKSLETKYIDNFQDGKGNGVKPADPFSFLMGAVRQLRDAKVQLEAAKSQLEAQVKEIQADHPGESALGPESTKERTELGKVSQRLDHAEKLLAQLEGDIRSVDLTDYLRENKLSTSKESFRSNYLVRFNAVVNMLRETAPPSEQQAQMDALKQLISN